MSYTLSMSYKILVWNFANVFQRPFKIKILTYDLPSMLINIFQNQLAFHNYLINHANKQIYAYNRVEIVLVKKVWNAKKWGWGDYHKMFDIYDKKVRGTTKTHLISYGI